MLPILSKGPLLIKPLSTICGPCATLRQRSDPPSCLCALTSKERVIRLLVRASRDTWAETLARRIDKAGTIEVRRYTQFTGVSEGILAQRVSLGEEEVEFVLVCGLLFLLSGERGSTRGEGVLRREGALVLLRLLGLFGKGAEGWREGWALLRGLLLLLLLVE